jgi:hypothetical protein
MNSKRDLVLSRPAWQNHLLRPVLQKVSKKLRQNNQKDLFIFFFFLIFIDSIETVVLSDQSDDSDSSAEAAHSNTHNTPECKSPTKCVKMLQNNFDAF